METKTINGTFDRCEMTDDEGKLVSEEPGPKNVFSK